MSRLLSFLAILNCMLFTNAGILPYAYNLQTSPASRSTVQVQYLNYKNDDDFHRIVKSIIEQYGFDGNSLQPSQDIESAAASNQASVFTSGPVFDNRITHTAVSSTTNNQILSYPVISNVQHELSSVDNTPVPKDYASNFLPEGIDVVPGSSYLPFRQRK